MVTVWSTEPVEKKPSLCRSGGLSSLPDLAIDTILERLPIRDAIRASLLSRDWRYRWETIPDLVFNENTFPVFYSLRVRKTVREDSVVSFMNRVMLLHKAETMRRFELTSVPIFNGLRLMLDTWATKLARSGVQELVLVFGHDQKYAWYDIHTDFFSCRRLTSLKLLRCAVKLPEDFAGFPCLTNLTFRHVYITNPDLGRLVSGSPQLKRLCLVDCFAPYDSTVDMHAPSLQSLELHGVHSLDFASIYAPMLTSAIIRFNNRGEYDIAISGNLATFLSSSEKVQKMEIGYFVPKSVCVTHTPPTLISVKTLRLEWNLHCFWQTYSCLYLIESFPALNHLYVDNNMSVPIVVPLGNYWEEHARMFDFSNLRSLELNMADASDAELEFVSFVQEMAPLLEVVKLNIRCSLDSKKQLAFESLLDTKRPSTKLIVGPYSPPPPRNY